MIPTLFGFNATVYMANASNTQTCFSSAPNPKIHPSNTNLVDSMKSRTILNRTILESEYVTDDLYRIYRYPLRKAIPGFVTASTRPNISQVQVGPSYIQQMLHSRAATSSRRCRRPPFQRLNPPSLPPDLDFVVDGPHPIVVYHLIPSPPLDLRFVDDDGLHFIAIHHPIPSPLDPGFVDDGSLHFIVVHHPIWILLITTSSGSAPSSSNTRSPTVRIGFRRQ